MTRWRRFWWWWDLHDGDFWLGLTLFLFLLYCIGDAAY